VTSAGAAIAGTTVTRKLTEAEPPEFAAVTVTVSPVRSVSVGIDTSPVPASMVAPAPLTAKVSPAPVKSSPAITSCGPEPWVKVTSARPVASAGGAWVTTSAVVSASTLPAALLAVTRTVSALRSSAGPGR
jgi:hypothetical protein